jgi:hypothetical protein
MARYIILAVVLILGIAGIIFMSFESGEAIEAAASAKNRIAAEAAPFAAAESAIKFAPVTFSHAETFYSADIDVELLHENPDAIIFFTLDGSPPDRYSQVYDVPIRIPAGSNVRATTIKAIAIHFENEKCDGIESPAVTNSYIVGRNVFERFTPETYVFVLSADPFDLYDYHHGIAIRGFLRDNYIANEGRGGIEPPTPANFNIRGRESERNFYVEAYDFEGNTLIHQAVGGRVQGGWSRDRSQKSWRLIARNEYSDGKFRYDFFDNTFNYYGQLIDRFDRLILRNGANDYDDANLRDELAGSLAKQAGFPDVQAFAPAAVFLNGEYYGFAWLKESLCYGYLVQTYGGLKDNYYVLRNTEAVVETVSTLERLESWDISNRSRTQIVKVEETGDIYRIEDLMFNAHWVKLQGSELKAYNDWYYVYHLAKAAVDAGDGFLNDTVFEEFSSLLDIDNFMLYYAFQVYIDNRDWPNNNVKVWRYYADEDEIITCSFNDGKWRFLMYDIEFSLGIYNQGYSANTLSHVLGGRGAHQHMGGQSILLQAVLQREDMREMFINTLCDLMSGALSTDNIISTLDEIIRIGDPELIKSGRHRWGDRETIRGFARRRAVVFPMHMLGVFEIPDDTPMFTVTLSGAEGADAWLNTRKVTRNCAPVTTSYYSIHSVPVKVQPDTRYEFTSWEVNGVHYYEPDMKIIASMADGRGNVNVILHTEKIIDGVPLYINELCIGDGADWISLYNPNSVSVSTRSYFLSDDVNNLHRWKIPTISIQPGESLIIVMKNNNSPDIIMKPQANFNLRAGETLFLSDFDGEILDMAEVHEILSD